MKKASIVLASVMGALLSSCQDHSIDPVTNPPVEVNAWRAGGTGEDEGRSVAVDVNGNVYVTGPFYGTATFGSTTLTSNGQADIFIVKYNNNGEVQWAKSAGAEGYDMTRGIAVDGSSNVFIVGYFSGTITLGTTTLSSNGGGDVIIAKLNSSGDIQWAKNAGGSGFESGNAIALDKSGNIYIGGSMDGTATFSTTVLTSNGKSDAFTAKYNSNGDLQWAKREGGVESENITAIGVDDSGNTYITGYFGSPTSSDASTTTIGTTTLTAIGRYDTFIAKLNGNGDVQWAKSGGGKSHDTPLGIAVDGSGNAYISGYLTGLSATFGSTVLTPIGDTDIFFLKYNSNGELQWAKIAGGTGADQGQGIVVDGNSNIYMTGNFSGTFTFGATTVTSNGDRDIFISKYNSDGDVQWVKTAGGDGADRGLNIAVDGAGKAYVTGVFSSTATFGSTTLTSSGDTDMFVAKF